MPTLIGKNGLRNCFLSVVAAVAAFMTGCGTASKDAPQRAPVSGVVTLGMKPIESGVIRFIPIAPTKGPATSAAISEGRFSLPSDFGPVVGKNRIEIEATDPENFPQDDEAAYRRIVASKSRAKAPPRVPEAYNRRSNVEVTISSDQANQFELHLDPKGGPVKFQVQDI